MAPDNRRAMAREQTCAAAASSSSSSPSSSTSVAMLVKLDSDPKKMLSLARGVTGMLPLELAKLARERELARESAWAESEGRGVGCARRSIVLRASLRRSRELLTPIICIAEPARLRTAPFGQPRPECKPGWPKTRRQVRTADILWPSINIETSVEPITCRRDGMPHDCMGDGQCEWPRQQYSPTCRRSPSEKSGCRSAQQKGSETQTAHQRF